MKVCIETDNLSVSKMRQMVDIIAAEAVQRVGDILLDIAERDGIAPLPMGVFAQALLDANNGCGPLEVSDDVEMKKGIQSLKFLAKEFVG